MTIKHRIIERADNALIILILLIVMGAYSCAVKAQSFKPIKYFGFEASFGTRSFDVKSNISAINQMRAGHEGGSLGVVFGNDVLKARIRGAGFYYSNANTPHTQEVVEAGTSLNFYPLQLLNSKQTRLRPYLIAGGSLTKVRFYGKYLSDQISSKAYEPFLGKVSQIMATGGVGIEYQLASDFDFIHIFMEAVGGSPIQSNASSDAFSQTSIKRFTAISLGVSFGRKR
jgi:hypothetical protein